MKMIVFLLMMSSSCAFGQHKSNPSKDSSCSVLIKQGYTEEFCSYNLLYQFKGISFESKFNFVDSLMKLKRVEYWANVYDINNEKYLDWGITKFTRGYVQFQNEKFICVSLDLMDDKNKVPYYKFEGIIKYLSEVFGNPKLEKTSNENITLYEWSGNKLTIDLNYINPTGIVSLKICSNNLSSNKTLDNL